MSDCAPLAIYNHAMFEVVDNHGNIIRENNPEFSYWSGEDGRIRCPKYEYQSHSTPIEYWMCAGVLIPMKLFISYVHIRIAAHLIKKRRSDGNVNNGNQPRPVPIGNRRKVCYGIPFTTVFELLHTIVVVIGAIAFGLHERMTPIEAHMFISLACSTFLISLIFSTMKIIHLGKRLLPISMRGDRVKMNNNIKGDKILLFLFSTMVLSEIIAPIFSFIVATITKDTRMSLYSLTFHGIAAESGILILVRQGTRLISYMIESKATRPLSKLGNSSIVTPSNASSKLEEVDQVTRLIHRMKVRTMISFVIGTPPAMLLILGGLGVFPYYWYFLYVLVYGISITSFASAFMFLPRGMSLCCCLCQPNINNKGVNKDKNNEKEVSSEKVETSMKMINSSGNWQLKLLSGAISPPNSQIDNQYHHNSINVQSQDRSEE